LIWVMSQTITIVGNMQNFYVHLFISVFDKITSEYLTKENIEQFSDLVSSTLVHDCEVVDLLVNSNWKGMSKSLINYCARVLFPRLSSKGRVDLLMLTKELGDVDFVYRSHYNGKSN